MLTSRSIVFRALVATAFVSLVLPATGSAQTAQICLSNQTRSAGTSGRGAMRCYVKAMKKGLTLDPACISAAEGKLTSKYSNTESISACLTEPAAASVWASIQPFVVSSGNALSLAGGRCSSKKMGALSRAYKQMTSCYAYVAENSEAAVDPGCLLTAESRLSDTFTRIETSYAPCLTTNDAAALGGDAATVTDTIFAYLRGIGTTTTSTTTTSTSTSTTLPAGTCSQAGDDIACQAYADIPACKSCVDATVGPNAGVATGICTDAGPVCGYETLDISCALAINTTTTCGGVCCP